MADLIDIAIKELGTKETGVNGTKYGKYTGTNGLAWCHAFIAWCANEAGVVNTLFPKNASCSYGESWFRKKKRFKVKGSYTPKRNDIMYMTTNYSHVGIVESVSGNTLHTIEGNHSDQVMRVTRSLNDPHITGYGIVSDYIKGGSTTSTTSTSSSATSDAKAKSEQKYLKEVLAKTDKPSVGKKTENYTISSMKEPSKVDVLVMVKHLNKYYDIPAKDGMKVEWTRKNTPGKLTFTTNSKKLSCGDPVSLKVNGTPFFYGFVFTLKPQNDGMVDVTVYDQLRYFKNKDSYLYKKKTATKLLRMIAKDFKLQTGTLKNTKHIVTRNEENKTLFDIMENCLTETMWSTGKIYTLYDNFGKLMLREPWKVKVLIDQETGQGYDYSISIDKDYYNQIKLVYENKKKGTLDVYMTKSTKAQNKYGVLQYYEKTDTPSTAKLQGKVLLQMYNKVARQLSISGAFGSLSVRAGCLLPVIMTLYDKKVSSYMLVDKVTHTFENHSHTMDLDLSGGAFDSDQ